MRDILVSIVSIQADQSRLEEETSERVLETRVSIVSIQADQSRPFTKLPTKEEIYYRGFNRINSGRSIPTSYKGSRALKREEVSIVSIQADQSRPITITSNLNGK